ncbi:hypothetical protein DHEL01_v205246 [Diaporthe helianthi]|uniref:Uncharacterized protein n=1 Tax=Diaporthe helianthi TaxID=158607 RepID=A0A2P5I1G2_DIAHE|nr:hypothetical protein DHEL01_v205246 [Diaporthe helianthi]
MKSTGYSEEQQSQREHLGYSGTLSHGIIERTSMFSRSLQVSARTPRLQGTNVEMHPAFSDLATERDFHYAWNEVRRKKKQPQKLKDEEKEGEGNDGEDVDSQGWAYKEWNNEKLAGPRKTSSPDEAIKHLKNQWDA